MWRKRTCHRSRNRRRLVHIHLQPSSIDKPMLKVHLIVQIRRYEPYMVAEVDMPAGSGPAGGDGFNDLAGYIFGGNNR